MHVGLGRDQRRAGPNLPPWLEEYGGWIAAAALIIVIVVPFQMMGLFKSEPVYVPTAMLRVVSGPTKKWAEGSSSKIESVSVELENLGPQAAQGVVVSIAVRGSAFPLQGAAAIEAGKRERYTGTTTLNVQSQDQLVIQMDCSNCPVPTAAPVGN